MQVSTFAAVLKELGVPNQSCLHLELLRLTADSTSSGGKGGGRYRSMGPLCLGLRMLRGQQRTHICRNGIVFIVFLEFVTTTYTWIQQQIKKNKKDLGT